MGVFCKAAIEAKPDIQEGEFHLSVKWAWLWKRQELEVKTERQLKFDATQWGSQRRPK